MSETRRNSIGTLTGWQLLAKQVARDQEEVDAQGGSLAGDSSDGDDAEAATDTTQKQRAAHRRSLSNASNLSEDSGLGGSAAPSAVTPRPHQWLYKEYRILDEIGSGGFGRVCRARRLADSRVVVVKEINTTSLSAKQKSATMDEVLVLSKLNHPNIVQYHDCYMDAVYINIVMEYCNAGDLAGLIKARAGRLMPEEEIMALFVQICLAMHYVHSAGVLHRDLKTSNVLITRADNFGGMPLLKLGDFGVAKINSAESSMASTIVGTPQYLSPEMCDNKPYGKKSDVWALGCILYELCSLSKAFDLGSGGISGIILKIMKGSFEPLPTGYSEELKGLVAAMLNVKPKRRPGVGDVLNMPYVRRHLALYLDWARNVPQAHPQILLASLGELWPRKGQQQQQDPQQQQQAAPGLETIGSGGSYSSLDTPQHGQLSPQHSHPQQLEQQGSGSQLGLYAASNRAATPRRISGTGSSSSAAGPGSTVSSTDLLYRQGSNMSASARSGSATPRSAAAAASVAASHLAPAGSIASEQQQQQQQQHNQAQVQWASTVAAAAAAEAGAPGGPATATSSAASSPLGSGNMVPPAASGPSGGPPPGSLSGWLGGDTSLQKRQQIQQQVLAEHSTTQHDRQQQQQRQASQLYQQQQQVAVQLGMHAARQASSPVHLELSPLQQQQQQFSQQQQQQLSQQMLGSGNNRQHSAAQAAAAAAAAAMAGAPSPLGPSSLNNGSGPHTVGGPHPTAANAAVSLGPSSSGWAYPSVSADVRMPVSRTSIAQEQLEGLKAIWGLKAKLQIKPEATGAPGSGPLLRDFLQQQQQLPHLPSGVGSSQQQQQQQQRWQQQQAGSSRLQQQQQQQQQVAALQMGSYQAIVEGAEADAAMHI